MCLIDCLFKGFLGLMEKLIVINRRNLLEFVYVGGIVVGYLYSV